MKPSRTLKCPNCDAAFTGKENADGYGVCEFCQAHFPLRELEPPKKEAASPAPSKSRIWLLVVVLLLMGFGLSKMCSSDRPERKAGDRVPKAKRVALRGSRASKSVAVKKSTAEAPPEVVASAEFTYHRTFVQFSSHYIFGQVKNTSPFPIRNPEIIVVLRDQQDKEIDTGRGFAGVEVIGAGKSAPVKVILSKPPPYKRLSFEVVAHRAKYLSPQAKGLKIKPQKLKRARFGKRWLSKGKVNNTGAKPARFIKVRVNCYDKEDKIVGMGTVFAKTERLDPGAWARYEVSLFFSQHPVRCTHHVSGRPAK